MNGGSEQVNQILCNHDRISLNYWRHLPVVTIHHPPAFNGQGICGSGNFRLALGQLELLVLGEIRPSPGGSAPSFVQ